jgi:hypothetical protein
MQRKLLIFLLIFGLFSQAASAALFKISEPRDQLITYQEVLYLKGRGPDLAALAVNGIRIEVLPDGSFTCGLILKKGKNLAYIMGWDKEGRVQTNKLRILRLISFPDAERKFDSYRHWARHEIITLATLGIVEGYPDNNFYMERNISKGEFATYLARARGLEKLYPDQDSFLDVPKEHWRAPYIEAVVQKKYMRSYSREIFGLEDSVTRGEAANIIVKLEGKKFLKEIQGLFYDVPKSHPYYAAILLAKKAALVKGVSRTRPLYDPNRDLSRAEAAILFSRFAKIRYQERWLFNFKEGFTSQTFCAINTAPQITEITITPPLISLLDESVITIRAKVEDREGLKNILNVKADLSPLGGPPDAEMLDNGRQGDLTAEDGEYALRTITSAESWGEKYIDLTVTDKAGWQNQARGSLTVVR